MYPDIELYPGVELYSGIELYPGNEFYPEIEFYPGIELYPGLNCTLGMNCILLRLNCILGLNCIPGMNCVLGLNCIPGMNCVLRLNCILKSNVLVSRVSKAMFGHFLMFCSLPVVSGKKRKHLLLHFYIKLTNLVENKRLTRICRNNCRNRKHWKQGTEIFENQNLEKPENVIYICIK